MKSARAKSHDVPATSWSSSSSRSRQSSLESMNVALEARVPARGLLAALEREALPLRLALDPGEEVRDRLVAERGDADAPTRAHERDRRLRALPRLPRARRALHEEVAAVERERGLGHGQVEPRPRQPPLEDLDERAATLAVEVRLREPLHRVAVLPVRDRLRPGMSAAGSGSSARAFAAPERHGPALVVDLDTS